MSASTVREDESIRAVSPLLLRPHPETARVPELAGAEWDALLTDIGRRGIVVPLDVDDELVLLDGRQRLRAALELGLPEVSVRFVAPTDPVEFIVKAALQRRDLNPSRKAALMLELAQYEDELDDARARSRANLKQRRSEVATLPPRGKTRDRLANSCGASARVVQDVATVHRHDPQLFERIKTGEVSSAVAARKVRRRLIADSLPDVGVPPDGPFELIYADPPWQLGNPDSEHAPEQYYATQPTELIKQLPIPAAENAVLFLWAVNSMLPQALEVIDAWGFTYKTHLVWVKPSIKLGTYFRNQHELLLFGRKGNYPVPDPEDRVASVIEASAGRHSAKPARAYELIERSYAQASKLELYARGKPRPGWVAWGNEVSR
jgi:N6-adenosine-specific RNA methylase IME4/ParB-like chromosome segregation protein Spo0J